MWQAYWRTVRPFVSYSLLLLAIFALLFYEADLDWQIYRLGMGITLFCLAVMLLVRLSLWHKEQVQSQALKQAQAELKRVERERHQAEQELHDYFLLWVHQMKTPIAASVLLLSDMHSQEADALRMELTQIERYTNMTLAYLKIKSPERDLHVHPCTVDSLVHPLILRYRLAFIHQHIHLHYTPIKAEVVTDPNWSQLMIEQIINNAIKYAPQAEVWITYDSTTGQLMIRDSGVGIPQQDLPKIFDKGYSGFNGDLSQKASGIGLFLVQQIAERLNQPVTVTSTKGVGTTFTIQLRHQDLLLTK